MIIYKRKKKQLVIPCGLGPVVCPEGNYELQMKMVDPSTSLQYVEPNASYYGLYRVIVNPVTSSIDPNLLASNIRRNVTILGVTGSFDGGPLESKDINSSTAQQIVTPDEGYYGLSNVTVEPFTLESKSQNINFNGSYDITPDQADGLSKVTVNVSIGGITPVMQSKTVDSSTIQQTVTPDSSYDGLSSVTVEPYNLEYKVISKDEWSSLANVTVTPSEGYDGLARVIVERKNYDFNKLVDSSTVLQEVWPTPGKEAMFKVTVNPYTVESKNETITQNGQYVFNPSTADALSSVSIDVSVEGAAAVLQSKTVDPSTAQVNVTPDQGYDGLSGVTVNPIDASLDADLIPENIKQGVEIFGVTGTYAGQINNQNKTVDCSTLSQSITFDNGYTGLGTVTVNAAVLQDLSFSPLWRMTSGGQMVFRTDDEEPGIGMNTVTISLPTWEDKTFNPSTNSIVFSPYTADNVHFLRDITINAVTSSIDPNIAAGNIKNGVTILGVTGTYTGTQGSLMSKTVNSSTSQQVITPDSGYYGLSQVTVNPYTLQDKILDFNSDERWDPSMQAAIITPDSSYDGLSSVAVTLETKYVDASTRNQTITATPDSSYFALDTVYIRPVTAAIDSNIIPENIKKDVSILGVTGTYEGSEGFTDSVTLITSHSIISGALWEAPVGYISGGPKNVEIHPDMSYLSSSARNVVWINEKTIRDSSLLKKVRIAYNYYANNGVVIMMEDNAFSNCPNLEYLEVYNRNNTGNNIGFYLGGHRSSQNWTDTSVNNFTVKMNWRAFTPANDTSINLIYGLGSKLTNIILDEGPVTDDLSISLSGMSLDTQGVYNILSSLDLTVSGKSVTFYSGGLTVMNDSQNLLYTAYTAAINAGWTINNLTITPYS